MAMCTLAFNIWMEHDTSREKTNLFAKGDRARQLGVRLHLPGQSDRNNHRCPCPVSSSVGYILYILTHVLGVCRVSSLAFWPRLVVRWKRIYSIMVISRQLPCTRNHTTLDHLHRKIDHNI